MTEVILVLNAGSSSIKFSIFATERKNKSLTLVYRGEIAGIGTQPHFFVIDNTGKRSAEEHLTADTLNHEDALLVLLRWLKGHAAGLTVIAAGHRVVHGSVLFYTPVLINATVISQLEKLIPLSPLHQPHNLSAI